MSMRTYGGMITGCVIRDVEAFIKKYIELNPEEFKDCDDPYNDMEMCLMCNESFRRSDAKTDKDVFHASMYTDDLYYDTATLWQLRDCNSWNEDLEMPFILVEADKSLRTRFVLESKFYKSKEEIINEFKAKLEKYLPEDFDWEGSIGDVEYAL